MTCCHGRSRASGIIVTVDNGRRRNRFVVVAPTTQITRITLITNNTNDTSIAGNPTTCPPARSERPGGALRISATAHPPSLRPCRRPANNCAGAVHCTSCREVRLGDVCVPVAAKSRGARYTVMRSVSLLP